MAQGSIRTGYEEEIVVGSGWVVWLESVQLKMKEASEDKWHEKGGIAAYLTEMTRSGKRT